MEKEGEECSQVIAIKYLKNWENTQNRALSIKIGAGNRIYNMAPILRYNCVFS